MTFQNLLTRRNILIAVIALTLILGIAAFFALRRPPRVAMEKYIPSTALVFIEIDNLPDLLDGITDTRAWRETAPVLGLSSQLRQLGSTADLMGRTGLGPDEAVVAARAQYAVALTGIEAATGATDEGPYLHFKLRFALVVETHAEPEAASRLVRERASILAHRIYGDSTLEETQDYLGTPMLIFHGPEPERQMVAASSGSVVVISNHADAAKICLDAINHRTSTLADDGTLRENRPIVGARPSVFAYVTATGFEKLSQLGPAIIASRFTTDANTISVTANLFAHLARQAAAGFLYSSEFEAGGVTEKYLTVLQPQMAGALTEPLKPAPAASFDSLKLIPAGVEDFTLLSVENAGDLPDRVLKQLSPRVDIVAGMALREFVLNFRKQLGVDTTDQIGNAIGDEISLLRFSEDDSLAMLVRVNDQVWVSPALERYLTQDGFTISTTNYKGTEIRVSSHPDGRAAAYAGNYLILGTTGQIESILDTQTGAASIAGNERFNRAFQERPSKASIISYRPEVKDVGETMLAISKLTRTTDGSRDLLDQDSMRAALDRVMPSVSFTEFRDYGIYTETRSAIGNYSLIASLIGGE